MRTSSSAPPAARAMNAVDCCFCFAPPFLKRTGDVDDDDVVNNDVLETAAFGRKRPRLREGLEWFPVKAEGVDVDVDVEDNGGEEEEDNEEDVREVATRREDDERSSI